LRPGNGGMLHVGGFDMPRYQPAAEGMQRHVLRGQPMPSTLHSPAGHGHVLRHGGIGLRAVSSMPSTHGTVVHEPDHAPWISVQLGRRFECRLRDCLSGAPSGLELLLLRLVGFLLPLAHGRVSELNHLP